jgi:hypothetical protein
LFDFADNPKIVLSLSTSVYEKRSCALNTAEEVYATYSFKLVR